MKIYQVLISVENSDDLHEELRVHVPARNLLTVPLPEGTAWEDAAREFIEFSLLKKTAGEKR